MYVPQPKSYIFIEFICYILTIRFIKYVIYKYNISNFMYNMYI